MTNSQLSQFNVLLLASFAFFCFGTHDALSKLSGLEVGFALTAVLIQCWRTFFLAGYTIKQKKWNTFVPRRYGITLIYMLLQGVGMLGFYFAVTRLPLVELFIVILLRPVVTTILVGIFLNERISKLHILALSFGLLAMCVTFQVWDNVSMAQSFNMLGIVGGMINVLGMSTRYIFVKRYTLQSDIPQLVLYSGIGILMVALPFLDIQNLIIPSLFILSITALAGVIMLVGDVASMRANHSPYVAVLAASHFSILLWVGFYGWLLFNEIPNVWSALGVALIALTSITLYFDSRKKAS